MQPIRIDWLMQSSLDYPHSIGYEPGYRGRMKIVKTVRTECEQYIES